MKLRLKYGFLRTHRWRRTPQRQRAPAGAERILSIPDFSEEIRRRFELFVTLKRNLKGITALGHGYYGIGSRVLQVWVKGITTWGLGYYGLSPRILQIEDNGVTG